MELKQEESVLYTDSDEENETSDSGIEIELYNELVSFIALSPEEQRAYLERLADNAAPFAQAVEAFLSTAEVRPGEAEGEDDRVIPSDVVRDSDSKRPSRPPVSNVSIKSLPGGSPVQPASANIVVRDSDPLPTGASDQSGDANIMIDTSTWFSDDDSFGDIIDSHVRPVTIQDDLTDEAPVNRRTGKTGNLNMESALSDEALSGPREFIALVICRECNNPSDSNEMYCPACGAFLVEKESS
ncbi:MAG: hypothetical protein L0229_11610 [Blastocatellia bacterium]|nr:hypothetical protein [Blastocatellia bacterium]